MNAISLIRAENAHTVDDIARIAQVFLSSGLFGVQTAAQAAALMFVAQCDGHHPASAVRDYDIIDGRPAKRAEAMLRDFIRSGGSVEWHELTDLAAEATFCHPQGGEVRIGWDLARAARAQLGGMDMWRRFPRQMLRARVVSEGVRTVCPVATGGLYVPEEVRDFTPDPPLRLECGGRRGEEADACEETALPDAARAWHRWRLALARLIFRSPNVAELRELELVSRAAVEKCDAILPDTALRFERLIEATLAKLEAQADVREAEPEPEPEPKPEPEP